MDMSVQKRSVSRPLAVLAVAVGVLGCMVFASTSAAAVPPTGLNCVASDGKINGRGATFQERAQLTVFATGYRDDYCGNVAEQFAGDPAGNTMLAYNYAAAKTASATGSGAGLKATSCRTDAFAGTDIPYTESNLKELNETAGKYGEAQGGACKIAFTPPFQPNSPATWPDTEAGKVDSTAPLMSYPVAGSAVAPVTNITTTTCGGKPAPLTLSFTGKELSRINGGDAQKWNDAELVANNPELKECTGAIARVVRQDSSGTTSILKQYLIRTDNERTGQGCGLILNAKGEKELQKWTAYFKTNTEWPGKQKVGEEGTCTAITTAVKSGNGELLAKLKETDGGIGYADLNEAKNSGLLLPNVQNSTGTTFQPPASGNAANCSFTGLSLPGLTSSDSVGLNPEDNWGNDNEEVNKTANHENATNLGTKFPICGLTFMLVYSGLNNGAVASPISRLSADQRRTLYSYSTFILSTAAQELLSSTLYSPLPFNWLAKLSEGFHTNF
jgi:ABC-type phosphate transport system substrate-binding protein